MNNLFQLLNGRKVHWTTKWEVWNILEFKSCALCITVVQKSYRFESLGSCLSAYKAYSGEACPLPLQQYLAVHVFFSYKYALFLFVPEPIFMDNLLEEEIWPRWVGVTGLYLMATANNLLTAKRVSYLTVTMSSKGDISGCVIIAVKSIFSASKKNGKAVEWWRYVPDRLVLIIQAQPQFPLTFKERHLELWEGEQERYRALSF